VPHHRLIFVSSNALLKVVLAQIGSIKLITGELKSKVDKVWDAFWSGGISNGLTVIEQITYLLFVRRLDELHTAREKKANLLKKPIEEPIFLDNDLEQSLRWSRFKDLGSPEKMYELFRDKVFPFIKDTLPKRQSSDNAIKSNEGAYAKFMKDAVFVIPTPSLFARVVDMLNDIPMEDRDTKGDLYEYLLSKIASAGTNGQFRTPRHIIKLMVDLMQPKPDDIVNDPACGTCGFLVETGEYLRRVHPEIFYDEKKKAHFNNKLFCGTDFDSSMLRIGAMNMVLHGVENPHIDRIDALSETGKGMRNAYTLILANPPFTGSLNYDEVSSDLLALSKTKKTELLFVSLFLQQLKPGGRCACIVPDGVLFGASKAHVKIREHLVEGHKLDGIISMPSGVFKPYAGVSTAIMIFTKTNSGGTDFVWFYDMKADGFSLDDKRDARAENDIPDILERWGRRDAKKDIERSGKAFFVAKEEIVGNRYDLSISKYKHVEHVEIAYESPTEILDQLDELELSIQNDLRQLREQLP
jgi:type I restriction enzyme M protein